MAAAGQLACLARGTAFAARFPMKILMTGATGFLGGRLLHELLAAGHQVACAGRRPPDCDDPRCTWLKLDFATTPAGAWLPHLRGMDAVINLVGIFRETHSARFEALHVQGAVALFEACSAAGVRRVVQVSALGADRHAETPFLASKYLADRHLLGLGLDACVAQPSLVFGTEGVSSRRLLALAGLPLLVLPAGGRQRVQPVHVDDAVRALHAMLAAPPGSLAGRRLPLVGPRSSTLAAYLRALRQGLGLPAGVPALSVPGWAVRLAARVGDWRRGALLDSAAWAMLGRGSTADASLITALLGRPPREAVNFIPAEQREPLRLRAQLDWLQPLLRLSLALVWLVTAWVSLAVYPLPQSLALLQQAGVPADAQLAALRAAVVLDLLLGLMTLLRFKGQRWLWAAQAGLILFYSAVIAWRLPEFWAHPYGPMVKNLPILALLALLWQLEPHADRRSRWTT